MAGKRPAWVDDLGALLRKHDACDLDRTRALRRARRFKSFKEAWKTWPSWDDMLWLLANAFDPHGNRWECAGTSIAKRYGKARDALDKELKTYRPPRSFKFKDKAVADLWRKFWPNPPKLPKVKPTKKGR